jgi:signal peptidase I
MFSSRLPKRGEVVVFRNERDKDQNYIKRIIGLPGDKIQLIGGIVHINDKPVEIREVGEYSLVEEKEFTVFKKYIEKLPEGYEHVIIKAVHFGQGVFDNVGPFNVPEGHYFMMGDNRDHSQDSRSTEAVGCIALENILGKAEAIFFSSSCSLFEVLKWPFSMRFERFCTPIR